MAEYFASDINASTGVDSLSSRLSGLETKSTDYYTSSSESDGGLSLLYTTLPHIIQRRLPKIRSLRYAASIYASSKTHLRSWSASSASSAYSESPPPSYHTRTSTCDSSADDTGLESDDEDERPELFTSAPSSRPSTSGSATPAPMSSAFKRPEDDNATTNIGSRSGHHGLALLNLAMRSQPTQPTTDPLNRRLYIDGISYILRGLPEDLTTEEALVLRAAAPPALLPPPAAPAQSDTSLQHQPKQQPSQPTELPTLLHRTTSTLTFYTLLLITFALPYLQTLFATLYALDARHRFSARFLTQTTLLLRLLAAQVLAVAAMAWGANDGALRHACRDFGVWVLRDVCGGMDEGVGRAVVGLRLEEKDKKKMAE